MTTDEYIQLFKNYNDPTIGYLKDHAKRFFMTKELVCSEIKNDDKSKIKILDIASGWLHNSVLYAMEGFDVTCCDLNGRAFDRSSVRSMARDFKIKLISYETLENPVELDVVGENTVDILMFTEVIEHITFNPVIMWKIFYKLLKNRSKIIITTPNYYFRKGSFAKDVAKILQLRSSGIDIDTILELKTYAHHWKEFSARDIDYYFRKLSPDFLCNKLQYVEFYGENSLPLFCKLPWFKFLALLFYSSMYVEIALTEKQAGIVVEPHW